LARLYCNALGLNQKASVAAKRLINWKAAATNRDDKVIYSPKSSKLGRRSRKPYYQLTISTNS